MRSDPCGVGRRRSARASARRALWHTEPRGCQRWASAPTVHLEQSRRTALAVSADRRSSRALWAAVALARADGALPSAEGRSTLCSALELGALPAELLSVLCPRGQVSQPGHHWQCCRAAGSAVAGVWRCGRCFPVFSTSVRGIHWPSLSWAWAWASGGQAWCLGPPGATCAVPCSFPHDTDCAAAARAAPGAALGFRRAEPVDSDCPGWRSSTSLLPSGAVQSGLRQPQRRGLPGLPPRPRPVRPAPLPRALPGRS